MEILSNQELILRKENLLKQLKKTNDELKKRDFTIENNNLANHVYDHMHIGQQESINIDSYDNEATKSILDNLSESSLNYEDLKQNNVLNGIISLENHENILELKAKKEKITFNISSEKKNIKIKSVNISNSINSKNNIKSVDCENSCSYINPEKNIEQINILEKDIIPNKIKISGSIKINIKKI